MKRVIITKVVSKNFITDFLATFQNMIGKNLTPYEKMVNRGVEDIEKELEEKRIRLRWYRYQITQLTNGAVVIMLYGDRK